MFDVYEIMGFVFVEMEDGRIYIGNLLEMFDKHRYDVCSDCLNLVMDYNSLIV